MPGSDFIISYGLSHAHTLFAGTTDQYFWTHSGFAAFAAAFVVAEKNEIEFHSFVTQVE